MAALVAWGFGGIFLWAFLIGIPVLETFMKTFKLEVPSMTRSLFEIHHVVAQIWVAVPLAIALVAMPFAVGAFCRQSGANEVGYLQAERRWVAGIFCFGILMTMFIFISLSLGLIFIGTIGMTGGRSRAAPPASAPSAGETPAPRDDVAK